MTPADRVKPVKPLGSIGTHVMSAGEGDTASRRVLTERAGGAAHPNPQAVSALSGAHPSRVTGLGIGLSDEWYTPRSVFEALDCQFDLDAAAPVDGPLHVPCSRWIYADSLAQKWEGFVWLNAPFGGRNALAPWLEKFFEHGDGVALTPDRTSAPWFRDAWRKADAVLLCRKTPFVRRDGSSAGSPAFGTTLWAAGERGVVALTCAARKGFGLLAHPRASALEAA